MNKSPTVRAILLAVSLCFVGLAGARSTEMLEMKRQSIADLYKPLSLDAMRHAILVGAAVEDWRPAADQPGVVTLAHNSGAGGHLAVVDVLYDAQGWQIVYRSSEDMNYKHTDKGTEIHPNYNKWIQALDIDIRHAMAEELMMSH